VTSPIGRGKDATFTVKTRPSTACSATFTPPSGAPTSDGLTLKTSDVSGTAFWTWRIASTTALGDGLVSANCGGEIVTQKIVIIQ
jgi:hypothetical protein